MAEGKRLACQVKSKAGHENPRSRGSFGIKKWECEVISNYNVASFIKEFVVKLPEGESLEFQSGGYIQIDVPEITVDFKIWTSLPTQNTTMTLKVSVRVG